MMHDEDYSFARACMAPDEQILWRGKPQNGHLISAKDALMIPFSILWCGFAIFWTVSVFKIGAPFFFWIFGLFFVCMGLYFVFGRFLLAAYLRKHTAYVITNKKIIRLRGKRIDFLAASTMPAAHCTANTDGSGTIRFAAPNPYYRGRYHSSYFGYGMDQGFFSLENVPSLVQVQQAIDSMDK